MGGVRALQARLSRRRDGAQIAADIGRRQTRARAGPRSSHGQNPGRRRGASRTLPCSGVEITVAFGSYLKSLRMRRIRSAAPARMPPPGGKLADRIGGDRRLHRHQRTRKDITDRRRGPRLVASNATSRTLSHDGLGAARSGALRDTETRERELIRRLRCAVSIRTLSVWVPKKSRRTVRSAGRGRISTRVRNQLLAVAAPRLQPQRAARETHRAFVTIGRDVTDVVDHARPVSFLRPARIGPVREIMQADGVGEVEQILLQRKQRFDIQRRRLRRRQRRLQRHRQPLRPLDQAVLLQARQAAM